MGLLVDGEWRTTWYEPDKAGAFKRPETQFRSQIREGSPEGFEPEAGRYHLYVSLACPWAHRTLIVRALRGLDDVIGVTRVDPRMGDDGWVLGGMGDEDPHGGAAFMRDVYLRADPRYTGRVTVPVLWDTKKKTIVNNESREIIRMLDTAFDALAKNPKTLTPRGGHKDVDAMLDRIYEPYNNGVYRAGFATSQSAYEGAVAEVFETLEELEALLSKQRYLVGDTLTEADVAMFTTSIRFAPVYYAHFKCNVRRIEDYPNVWAYVRELYQIPAIRETCDIDEIKLHYYYSQTTINPSQVVPVGPSLDLDAPHDRGRFVAG